LGKVSCRLDHETFAEQVETRSVHGMLIVIRNNINAKRSLL